MIDPAHFHKHVIRPTLTHLGMWSREAGHLMLGTAMKESGLSSLVQKGGGPALGVYQPEPDTHDDIWRYLGRRTDIAARVEALIAPWPSRLEQLKTNLAYATAIARLVYWRKPEPIPHSPEEQAEYWKRHYNTSKGRGTVEGAIWAFRAAQEV